ncbi:MORN repeat-containing protein [Flagellimonas nanhaiensis]|uniref:MORN repeat-containing protein n=1 Tax=Flagellimonas nanhaiensis TaxID=2292706 RepID=A0A371JVV9_9FLAO|nr:hypothetical protein [Allomuricauda nanhaiensis]RDY61937.1 hypothetical protein DX873_07280 [Allomuricauda nanhaiensis]
MGNKRTIYLLYFLLVMTSGAIIALLFNTNILQNQLLQEKQVREEISKQVALHEQLMDIDLLLVDGDYGSALQAYRAKEDQLEANADNLIDLRIALAEKMEVMGKQSMIDPLQNTELQSKDTLQPQLVDNAKEIQQYDSISFALEKAKVQLSRMKRLIQQKSFGEYLTFTSSKGSQVHYVGQVKDGKANGHGVAILSTGSRYEGEWKNNLRDGEGTFYWADGQHYEGEYKNDKRHGMGAYHWLNGEKFVGLWQEDQRTGEGTFYGKDGKVVASGFWEDDKLIAANKP